MTIVADESVDYGIITLLRFAGVDVISVMEDFGGYKDEEVLKLAFEKKCLLITEDKDFGELAYRLKLRHNGILLLRLNELLRNDRNKFAAEIIVIHMEKLRDNFSVLTKHGLRIKRKA